MDLAATRLRAPARIVPLLLAVLACGSVAADDLNGYFELRSARVDSTNEVFGSSTDESRLDGLDRRLYFLYNRQAYPRLRFWIGGTFDDIDATNRINGQRIDTDETRLRPYVGIGQRTRQWITQLSWNRDERRAGREGGPQVTTIRDGFFGSVSLSPENRYAVRGRLLALRNYDRDADRMFRDIVRDTLDLEVRQQVTDEWRWGYRGTLNNQTDDLSNNTTRTTAHRAEVGYSDAWIDRRVTFDGQVTVNRRENVVESSGAGQIELPVFPIAGLAARDDTPLLITLPPEPALIDDDVTTPTTINLGLPPPAGDDRPWALGLDFGTSPTVNTLFVWVDVDLPPEIASTFSWQVYTSANNQDWVAAEFVSSAPFDEFLHRFAIRFGDVQSRYVKVVVAPLAATVPGATSYPDIFVTELDAFQRIDAPSHRLEVSDSFERLLTNTRAKLLAEHELYYEGSIDSTWSSGKDTRYNMRHGLFFVQPLAPEATFSTRVAWEQFQQGAGRDRALVYSASLVVTPVERVQYTASVTGRNERYADEIGGDQIGVLFFGRATLFENVYVQLGAARNWREDPYGNTVASTLVNFSTRVEPRRDLILILFYDDNVSDNPRPGQADLFTRAAEINATYTPLPTIYLFGQYRWQWRSEIDPEQLRRIAASWAPFPAATFRLGLNYDETWRDLNEQRTRVAGPFLRWNFNPRSYLQAAYTQTLEESTLQRLENTVFSAILRWGF